jgi:tetratricopeptide (TPR) repeat protein
VKRFATYGPSLLLSLVLGPGLFTPVAQGQKSPPPPTPPPSNNPPPVTTPGNLGNVDPNNSQNVSRQDLILFLQGRVVTPDGSPVPTDALVERVCDAQIRQQVHPSQHGEFSMQLGSRNDSFLDATAQQSARQETSNANAGMGISRFELARCELRVTVANYSSSVVNLVDLSGSLSSVDVGKIVVQRRTKVEGQTLSASAYRAPKDAIKAYEKGAQAQSKGQLANAQKNFEKAVQVYPKYANAWFQLGTVLQKEQQTDEARKAFEQAASSDSKFLPPYLSLATLAYEASNWKDVLSYTDHILDLDPLNRVAGYVLDLDATSYTAAYFFNAVANYNLNKFAEAEKSGLKAVRLDLMSHFPQVHLLMADLFTRKGSYDMAIVETRTYLDLAPHGKSADMARVQLAKLEKSNGAVSAVGQEDQK